MSAPTTNVENQVRNHRSPVWGILAAVAFGLVMGAGITYTATSGDAPDGAAVQIDGRTGEVVEN